MPTAWEVFDGETEEIVARFLNEQDALAEMEGCEARTGGVYGVAAFEYDTRVRFEVEE